MPSDLSNESIAAMDYNGLQKECRKLGISGFGDAATLRQRLRALGGAPDGGTAQEDEEQQQPEELQNEQQQEQATEEQDPEPAAKRLKGIADDLVCPITRELPFDPVSAGDGQVYDRDAIERHFKGKQVSEIKSPMTNQPMGKRLVPAIQHKNLIQRLIDLGVIPENLAEVWNQKLKKKKEREDLVEKAQAGDAVASWRLGRNYLFGANGFKKDKNLAFQWC